MPMNIQWKIRQCRICLTHTNRQHPGWKNARNMRSVVRAKLHAYSARLKAPSSEFIISRYILQLGQAAQKQQRPHCPNPKMYLEIRRADERLFKVTLSLVGRYRSPQRQSLFKLHGQVIRQPIRCLSAMLDSKGDWCFSCFVRFWVLWIS